MINRFLINLIKFAIFPVLIILEVYIGLLTVVLMGLGIAIPFYIYIAHKLKLKLLISHISLFISSPPKPHGFVSLPLQSFLGLIIYNF